MTFDELIAAEPRLDVLAVEIRHLVAEYGRDSDYCAHEIWYGSTERPRRYPGILRRMRELVGDLAGTTFTNWRRDIDGATEGGWVGDWRGFGTPTRHPDTPTILIGREPYDVAYRTLYELLPPCNHESGGCRG